MMTLATLSAQYLPRLEAAMQAAVARSGPGAAAELRRMLDYHMGWEGEGAGPAAQGKRIRPLLALLAAQASGGDWQAALPAAAAVELLHNFSLIHDDIQDNSRLRRGRPTVWACWGAAQAINAGDALFTVAHSALLGLAETVSAAAGLAAARLLHETCLRLTQGQYLDMDFERRAVVSLDEYWQMIGGKTAALVGASAALGALAAGAPEAAVAAYAAFGERLGLAFQVQDDLLGIWGAVEVTGKSVESDLVAGKKSLPVVFALAQGGAFAARWLAGPVTPAEVPGLAAQLEAEGARAYAAQRADELTAAALEALAAARPQGEAGAALRELAAALLTRQA